MPVESPSRQRPQLAPRLAEGRIVYHPRYEQFLRRCGVTSAAAALGLAGEIVCGHPDRHVARVGLPTGRVVYVKREHVVGVRTRFRNARAGFGWVSRGEREAATLRALEAAGLPGPQWLAYGEDETGRAFLIVDELAGAADLRATLSDSGLSPAARRAVAEAAGRAVGRLHAAGFGTPELAAKHVFVHARSREVTLIDWQSAGQPAVVPRIDRVRQLAGLHASLGPELATSRDRLRFLRAYCREAGGHAAGGLARAVLATAAKVAARSSVRDQLRGSAPHLVWLADEAVCAIPEIAGVWPTPAAVAPFYTDAPAGDEWVTFPNGRRARLTRFRTVDPTGRLAAALRERPWRSPAAKAARLLFHLQRSGIAAPRLLAFGQRVTSAVAAESFVLYDLPEGAVPWTAARAQWSACGELLRRLHDAGCRIVPGDRPVFALTQESKVVVASPFAVRLVKHVSERARRADLLTLVRHELAGLSRTGRARLVRGYLGADRAPRKALLATLLSA